MLKKCIFLILLTIALMMASKGMIAAAFPIIVFMALASKRPEWIIFTILLFITATVGNNFFFKKGALFGIAERASLFLMAFAGMMKVAGRRTSKYVSPFLGILPYLLWMIVSSAEGWSPIVSYLKLVLFTLIYFAFYAAANLVAIDSRANDAMLRSVVLSIAGLFVIGSFLLIPFPGIGMMSLGDFSAEQLANGVAGLSLFKGMTMHSQSLGPIIAGTATLLFADLVFTIKKWDPLYVCMLLLAPILIYKTSSRTAMGSLIAGLGMVTWLLMRSRGVGQRWKGKVLNAVFAIAILGTVGLLILPSGRNKAVSFLLKFSDASSGEKVSFEQLTTTRQGLVDEAMYSFRTKPVQGNGFQVSYKMQFEKRSGLASYLSAPVEKGVWVSAVLEEGGAVGLLLLVCFMLAASAKLYRRKAYITVSVFFVLIVSNMGEFTMFSMSYTGGYLWALVFAATAMDAHRAKLNKGPVVGWNFRVR